MKVTVLADPYRNVEGGEIRINDFFKSGNRLLVLIFWAPWCPSCQASLPSILQKAEALAKLNGMLVGVSVEENEDKVRVSPMIQTMAGRIPCLMDSKGRLQEFFKVGIIPFAVAINAEGETVGSGRPEEVFESLGVGEDERSVQ
jgi:thiol-disulfide isomerase/thioredoxin